MYPVCVRLPAEPRLASALWTVLETGARTIALSNRNAPSRPPQGQHMETLLQLFQNKLTSNAQEVLGLWIERRELGDLLMVLDEGLQVFSQAQFPGEGATCYQEAVHTFLGEIRRQLPVPRKPISRHSTAHKLVQSMAASASGA